MTHLDALLSSFTLGSLTLRNRICLAPWRQEMAGDDGLANDWHFVHYGARAAGGAGLILTEAIAVEPRGRVSTHDLGLYDETQTAALSRIVDCCHAAGAAVCVQLSHAGRKSLLDGAVGATGAAFAADLHAVAKLSHTDIYAIIDAFHAAATRAVATGSDALEIHAAHGTLLHEFLSPQSNDRADSYGGDQSGRLRLLREVVAAVRDAMPNRMPLLVRLALEEQGASGYMLQEGLSLAGEIASYGVDLFDLTSGGDSTVRPTRFPGYLMGQAARLKATVAKPVLVGGMLDRPEVADGALREGRCDLVAIGRAFIRDPHWPLHAAEATGVVAEAPVPPPYDLVY